MSSRVLGREGLPGGIWDEEPVWFGVEAGVEKKSDSVPAADSGYFRLGDESSWAMIRAGQYTRRPYQADQLHVDIWWNGLKPRA